MTGAVRKPHLPVLVSQKRIKNGKLNSPIPWRCAFTGPTKVKTVRTNSDGDGGNGTWLRR